MPYKRLHADFSGVHTVTTLNTDYTVNLDTGECTCPHGAATIVSNGREQQYAYCVHKLKVLAGITAGDPDKLTYYYATALATRYNVFEVVSAFHKSLRRGDIDSSIYWGLVLSKFRGIAGVVRYMLNIIYEEGREHNLHKLLLESFTSIKADTSSSVATMCTAIRAFCVSPKKWDIPHRYDIFVSEMRGYELLGKAYGWSVAKPKEIIAKTEYRALHKALHDGIAKQDRVLFQKGIKGLFKSQYADGHDKLKYHILSLLDAQHAAEPSDVYASIRDIIEQRLSLDSAMLGYHELNALGDALMGEPIDAGYTDPKEAATYSADFIPHITLTGVKQIPKYAQDNHTYRGKHLMRVYRNELKPGAEQVHLDFRWCGAYFGVAWRMQAMKQHRLPSQKLHTLSWSDVTWDAHLYNVVDKMWY